MNKEGFKRICKKIKHTFIKKKEKPLYEITIIDGKVLINGREINRDDLQELVILFRINGM